MSVYPGSASKKATSPGRRPQQQQQRGEGRGLLSCCALSLPGQGRLGGGADKGRRRARPRGRPARKMGSRRPVATPAHARRRDIVANGPLIWRLHNHGAPPTGAASTTQQRHERRYRGIVGEKGTPGAETAVPHSSRPHASPARYGNTLRAGEVRDKTPGRTAEPFPAAS